MLHLGRLKLSPTDSGSICLPVDINGDGQPDGTIGLSGGIDIDGDGIPDIYIDSLGNVDVNGDGIPDLALGLDGTINLGGGRPLITIGTGPVAGGGPPVSGGPPRRRRPEMELAGLEPATFALRTRRSPS